MRYRFSLCLFLLTCIRVLMLPAQNNPSAYNYSYLTINEGLCDNFIRAIHKDQLGFVWIGTSNGLDRYDGYELKHYSVGSELPNRFIESNYIYDITEDTFMHLWVASDAGLTRINLQNEDISSLKEYKGVNNEVLTSPVQSIFVDERHNLWIGKSDGLAYIILNKERDIEEIKILKKDVDIRKIIRHDNDVWAGGKDQLLRYRTSNVDRIVEVPQPETMNFSKLTINALFSIGNYLWIGTQNGLYCVNTQSGSKTLYQHKPNDLNSISSNYITDIAKNESGDIIIATRNGLNIFQRNEQFVLYMKGEKGLSLNDNIVSKVFVDEHNRIWVGSGFSGISLMNPAQIQFTHSLQGSPDEKPFIISAILEDKEGNLLVGIVDGGLAIKLKGSTSFNFYTHQANDPSSLGHNNISDIVQDFEGNYWISTIGGGIDKLSKNNLSHPRFEHFTSENSELLSDDIQDLCLDPIRNSIWICNRRYIQILDFTTNRISQLQFYTRSREVPEHMNAIFVDSQSRLWIGGNGIHIIDLKDYRNGYECISYTHKLDDPESKVKEKITCILETKDREIYLGSMGNGIYQLDKEHSNGHYTFINYAGRSGLTNASISNLIEDEYGNIWISTLKGIYLFNAFTKRTTKFDEEDGLQVQQFYKRAGYKTASNQMILGTTNGLVSFNAMVHIPKREERVVTLTGFYCDGVELIPFSHKRNLSSSITQAKEIHLYPKQHSFELSYSSLEYTGQNKIYYFHRILELDESINVNRTRRNARYTHLHPGKYTFEVWCTNSDNSWSSERTYLSIIVHPPFYQTTWFYTLITLLVISAIFYSLNEYYQQQKRIQLTLKKKIEDRTAALSQTIEKLELTQSEIIEKNEQLQIQNEEIKQQKNAIYEMSQQMEQLNKEKISYFTNIAHEFKTPLALILGPSEQLIQNAENLEKKESLEMISRNARYLLSLVNQLMDLQKIDTNKLTLNPVQFNLVDQLNQTVTDFTGLMQQRGIHIDMRYRLKYSNIVSDKDLFHKILYNLLSNAVKYTPDKGNVTIHAAQFFNQSTEELMQYIAVTNSGSTINSQDAEKIFDRFYRIPGQQKYAQYGQISTGIGLHIVKEIITLLNGKIIVKSSDKNGVTFRLYFPITGAIQSKESVIQETVQPFSLVDVIPPFIPVDRDKPNLLLVEDNPDMRIYIKKILLTRFNVAEANNGESGFETAKKIVPDFIVSDLMMPICDGATFCRRIRENLELCHIPFLLLTANSSEKAYIESFENGIDGYITKPFEESLLLAQIESIIKNRDLRQQKFIDGGLNLSELEAGYSDQQFMQEVIGIIEKNYEDSNFGVKELVAQLNMSYTIVYKKFVSLSGIPPVKFLLLYRLRIAKMILERNKRNNVIVSEIAYRVGFNDPKYFTRCFVKQYNMTPSAIIHQEPS
jgi:signal transduction histidine kinase/ligand-binding sensor domain-containing protein/CheY-like chemotaxis protein/AraC-like DNA-binding protein